MGQDEGRTVELLRAAVESSPSGILMVDPDGKIVLVNREIERLFDYSREELLARSVDMLVPEAVRGGHGGFRKHFLTDPKVRAMGTGRDLYGLRRDGTQVPVEIGLTPVATEEGLFVLSSIVDISARKRAQARFRAAVESSPAGMVMIDREGKIVLVNREVERLFGYDREELIGESIELLVPERFREGHPGFRTSFYEHPDTRAMGAGRDLFGLRKDGSEVPVEIGLNPIETDEGLLILSSIVDISARKREEKERQRLEAQLRQAQKMEAVGTLAGGIAHDFNNILGAIMGYAELLQAQVEGKQARNDLEELIRFTERGKTLVERIQAFGRRQEATRVPLSLGRPVQEVAHFLRSSLGPGIRVETRITSDTPRILADPSAIHQVIMNLGMNAAQAMRGKGRLDIEVAPFYLTDSEARKRPELNEGQHVVVSIGDTGPGIDPEIQSRVFEPFFTTKSPGQGSGLGLAIVHGIVREHEGAIELESEVGKGTTVRVVLPAADVTEPEAEQRPDIPRGRGERILYVDDEPGLSAVGRRRLEGLGYEPVVAGDGESALDLFRVTPHDFDLVITDYLMPRMNGLELAEEIAEIRTDIPIILLTGYVDDLPEERIFASGVRELVAKPATLAELATRVRAVLDNPTGAPSTDS